MGCQQGVAALFTVVGLKSQVPTKTIQGEAWRVAQEQQQKQKSSCFPASATVSTREGPMQIGELLVGVEVLVDGGGHYALVHMLGHLDTLPTEHEYVRLELASGHELELWPNHYAVLFLRSRSSRSRLVAT